jgi:hypothetical protein
MPRSDVRSTWSSIATVNRPPFGFVTLFHLRLCQPRANDCARELTPRTGRSGKNQTVALCGYPLGRPSVMDGNSPKSNLYSPANRPNCQKPYRVAISVTVVAVGALS